MSGRDDLRRPRPRPLGTRPAGTRSVAPVPDSGCVPGPHAHAHAAGGDGWGDRPGDTALSIRVPEADGLVMPGLPPAHVTVLHPFLHRSRLDATTRRALRELFAAHPAFTLRFASFARWPGLLYLVPEPADPVRRLTRALTARWPEAVPYRGIFGAGLDPHLTVAHHTGPAGPHAPPGTPEPPPIVPTPLTCEISAVDLITYDGAGWRGDTVFPLGPAAAGPSSR